MTPPYVAVVGASEASEAEMAKAETVGRLRAADVVVAIGGSYGTLSELALALRTGVPVIGLGTWAIDGVQELSDPAEAVARALALAIRS